MYTLKTIADWHPMNILCDLVAPALKNRFEQILLLTSVQTALCFKPTLFANKRFISGIENYIKKRNPKADHEYVRVCLQTAREISNDQFNEINDKYSHVYLEGISIFSPNGAYAKKQGLKTTFLDTDNQFYWQMFWHGVSDLDQDFRETVWASKIESKPDINNSLLIVGAAHARNEYGLADKLQTKGIQLEIIRDYENTTSLLQSMRTVLPSD